MELCSTKHKTYSPRVRPSLVFGDPLASRLVSHISPKRKVARQPGDRELQENDPREKRGSHENGKHD